MRILWVVESMYAATTRYRVVIPARVLRQLGHQIDVVETLDRKLSENFNYDLVCLQRAAGGDVISFIHNVRGLGIPMVYDIDDDIFSIETSSPVYGLYMQRPDIPWRQVQAMRFASGLTVSTPQLEKIYDGVNPNLQVVPNTIDIEEWANRRFPKLDFGADNIMLVWEGSNTHMDSLNLALPTLERIMQRYPNVGLVFMGLDRLPVHTLPRARTFCFGWGAYSNLQSVLTACHIGLAPLAPSTFNLAKSNLRIMEYACAGLAVVGSPHGEYTTAIEGAGGVLCKTSEEWEAALEGIIESEIRRKAMTQQALAWAVGQDIRAHYHKWLEAWQILQAAI